MNIRLLPYSFSISDTGFYFETFRPSTLQNVIKIMDFFPLRGYISILTNLGEMPILWSPENYTNQCINKKIESVEIHKGVLLMNNILSIDDIFYSWSYKDDKIHIKVWDEANESFKAELIMNSDEIIDIIESSFSDPARNYQMLYYAEKNKALFREV